MFQKLLILACNIILNVIVRGVLESRSRAMQRALRLGFGAFWLGLMLVEGKEIESLPGIL